ncbi:MAG: hypothetical protein IAF02_15835 [Anaerolineae bacterium]|nr:hypothetical protein [Anaerolineae bacterium]
MNELQTSVGRLQTAVSPKSLSRFPKMGRWDRVAASILARYAQGTAAWQGMAPVFLEMGMAQTAVTHQHQHHHLNQYQLRPRLNLVLVQQTNNTPASTPTRAVAGTANDSGWQAKRPAPNTRHTTTLVERLQRHEMAQQTTVQMLTQRLNQQHQPLDMLSGQTRAVMAAAENGEEREQERPLPTRPSATTTQAVPRILRQPAPAPQETAPSTTHTQAAPEQAAPFGVSRLEMGSRGMMMETAVDINRLTDEVMQKLEYRLQAHRERTGRF